MKRKTRITQEFDDADYLASLTPSERQWYENFSREYYCHPSQSQLVIHQPAAGTELRRNARAQRRDVYAKDFSNELDDSYHQKSSNPEEELLAKEAVAERIRKKVKRKASQI